MTAPIAISIENLSKCYTLGETQRSLRENINNLGRRIFSRERPRPSPDFWALRNVSFEVSKGEIVGIIGNNGAGKSTLLKILSRITEPTEGCIRLRGRVASLLEVGTGFHPELTGRENIYLNGSILGLSRNEITASFDSIVEFSGVSEFLDTPIKRYSSGMYVRLAFAVAAHLQPEILVVDEVLAVGDVKFQEKCLAKMNEVAKSGRTILFVSHNLGAVERLCNRVVILERGKLVGNFANVRESLNTYLAGGNAERSSQWLATPETNCDNEFFKLIKAEVASPRADYISASDPITLAIDMHVHLPDPALQIGFRIRDETDAVLFSLMNTDTSQQTWPRLSDGFNRLTVTIPAHLLNEGKYRAELIACLFSRAWLIEPYSSPASVRFEIRGGFSPSPYWVERRDGVNAPLCQWTRADA